MTFTEDDMDHMSICLHRLMDLFGDVGTSLFTVAMLTAYQHPEWLQWWAQIMESGNDELRREGVVRMLRLMPVPEATR